MCPTPNVLRTVADTVFATPDGELGSIPAAFASSRAEPNSLTAPAAKRLDPAHWLSMADEMPWLANHSAAFSPPTSNAEVPDVTPLANSQLVAPPAPPPVKP